MKYKRVIKSILINKLYKIIIKFNNNIALNIILN